MSVGEKIRQIREYNKWTQQQLGELLGVSQQMIGMYESGKRKPKVETLLRIAAALGVPASSLLDNEEQSIIHLFAQEKMPDDYFEKLRKEALIQTLIELDNSLHDEKEVANSTNAILEPYNKLNDAGKQKAIEYTTDLAQMEKYKKKDSTPFSDPENENL